MLFILILPLLLPLKIWQKILWILTNYFFSIIFLFGFIFVLKNYNNTDLLEKISIKTPNQEYQIFSTKSTWAIYSIEDNYCLKIIENNSNQAITKSQFVSTKLLNWYFLFYNETELNQLKTHPDSINLKLKRFTLLKNKITNDLNIDLELTDILKDSSTFKTNREYFASLNEYLKEYKQVFTNQDLFNRLNDKKPIIVELQEKYFAVLYKIDNSHLIEIKNKYLKLEEKLDKRASKSSFIVSKLFYPIEFFDELYE